MATTVDRLGARMNGSSCDLFFTLQGKNGERHFVATRSKTTSEAAECAVRSLAERTALRLARGDHEGSLPSDVLDLIEHSAREAHFQLVPHS